MGKMTKLNVYLNFQGNAEEAFKFYQSIFGGEFTSVVRFKDMPIPGMSLPQKDENKMMHIALPVDNDVIMASDVPEASGRKLHQGNNIFLSLHPESKEEADRFFNGLSAGGKIEMPMAKQAWGDYYGSLTDKFGIGWMVNFATPKPG